MELQAYGQYKEHIPGALTESLAFLESKMGYDSRYRNIIVQLDLMVELIGQQPSHEITTELDRLMAIIIDHIGSENNFMALVGYPHMTKHRVIHSSMLIITDDLSRRFRIGQNVLHEELVNLRQLWLIHIKLHDRDFENFLASTAPVMPGNA